MLRMVSMKQPPIWAFVVIAAGLMGLVAATLAASAAEMRKPLLWWIQPAPLVRPSCAAIKEC